MDDEINWYCPSEEEMDRELQLYLAEKYELRSEGQAEKALQIYKLGYQEWEKAWYDEWYDKGYQDWKNDYN